MIQYYGKRLRLFYIYLFHKCVSYSPMPGCLKFTGDDFQATILGCLHTSFRHTLAADPPLGLQHWLYDVLAATAEGHAHLIVLSAPQQALAIQPLDHSLTHLTEATRSIHNSLNSRQLESLPCMMASRLCAGGIDTGSFLGKLAQGG